jgi:uncharacterized protein (TIGR03067 family)
MKRAVSLGLCALVLVASGVTAEEKDAKLDADKLVGKWTYVSGEKSGAKIDAAMLKDQKVTFTKENITLEGTAGKFVMKYTLDAKKSPVGIEMTMTESPFGAGATAKGIIELKGDDLKFCYNYMMGEAPKEFKTKEGSMDHLFVLKRAK